MLDQMRKSSQSLVITILFGVVIAVFILNFGPQSRGSSCEQAMGRNEHHAAEVSGETITTNDFRYGFLLSGGAQIPAKYAKQERLKEMVMDRLIDRELLAGEAERLGYAVTDEQVEDQIAEARIIGLGSVHNVPALQKDGKFDYDAFKSFVQLQLGVTPANFIEQQKKELMAARVRDLLRDGVTVSDDEVKAEFLRKNRQVNLEYMRFAGRRYEPEVAVTDAEIADYAAKNDAALRKAYDDKKFVYEKVPAQRHLREILVKVPKDAKPEAEKAAKAKADALAERRARQRRPPRRRRTARQRPRSPTWRAPPPTMPPARRRAAISAGAPRGPRGSAPTRKPRFGTPPPGTIVGPLRTSDGFAIVKMEGAREGEVSFENAKLELAAEKLREDRANARAKAAAEEAVGQGQAVAHHRAQDHVPAPQRCGRGGRREAGRGAPGRGDGAVRDAGHPRGGHHRRDWRLDAARQGRVCAHARGARGRTRSR